MIRNRTIICVASNWQLDPTSKHHVMKLLARDNRIVWVNYHGTRRPTVSAADVRSISSALVRVLRGPNNISHSMVQVTPFVIPAAGDGLLGRWNQRAIIAQVRRVLRRVQADDPQPVQVWTFAPDVAFLAGQFDEERFVYYCVDEYAEFKGFDDQAIRVLEQRLLSCADVIITSSEALYDAKRRLHANTHLVRHGVEHDHFSAALRPGLSRPPELRNVTGPIIGFFGLVHNWIDVPLLIELARRLSDTQLVLIGEVFVDVRELRALPNVHLLGRKPYADLPAFCASFDVAILPFKCNSFTRYINPIKLREYLAAGLPVVSTAVPEASLYVPEVTIASTVDAFVDGCREAMRCSTPADRARRSQSISNERWEHVVDRLGDIVMGNLPIAPHVVPMNEDVVASKKDVVAPDGMPVRKPLLATGSAAP